MSGTMLTNPFRFGPAAPYAANGVNFDGSNDYLTRGADLTGVADSKLWSGSVWFKRGTTGADQFLYWAEQGKPNVIFNVDNTLSIIGFPVSGGKILDIHTSAITDTASWHHVMWAVDMVDTAKRHLYVDGVSDLTVITYTNDIIDFSRNDHAIGAKTGSGTKYNGCLADFWLALAQYIDLSVASNRLKFYNAGNPVDLGSDGSTPTGAAPIMFFSGATATWHTNDGSGGGFTENGALTDCADSP